MSSLKPDLEQSIRDIFQNIRDYETIIQVSDAPLKRKQAQLIIEQQQPLLVRYLQQYARLCHGLHLALEQDIIEIALIIGVDLLPVVTQPDPDPDPALDATVPSPPDTPSPPVSTFAIPITLAEWRHTLTHERNAVFGVPAGYWCFVRSGTYHIGGWKEGKPSIPRILQHFWVARYPVTVAQFAQFIAAQGYETQPWWTPNGWKWRNQHRRTHPYLWDSPRFHRGSQPVVGVSWFEAVAFARWLDTQLRAVLPAGYAVRLPSEAEWEAAAAYDAAMQRCTYPWGEEQPDPQRAIYNADAQGNEREHPAPVGSCPLGTAACGALDMAGNVWEATVSRYSTYPTKSTPQHAVGDENSDVGVTMRGGSWHDSKASVRCGERLMCHPTLNYYLGGFRVFVAPHVHQWFNHVDLTS